MKNIFKYILSCVLIASAMIPLSCDEESLSKSEPAIYPSTLELGLPESKLVYIYQDETESDVYPMITGETISLSYTMTPDNVTYSDVEWSSSDETVATVDANGVVTAVSSGTAIITVSPTVFYSGSGIYGYIKVVVSSTEVVAESITLSSSSESCYVAETLTVTPTINPSNTTYKTVQFSSSDESVATVDNNGVVTGVSGDPDPGTTVTITATALDEGSAVSASIDVQIVQIVEPQSITIDQTYSSDNYEWAIGDKTYSIAYDIEPSNATKSLVEWTSSDETIATVSKGVVTFNQDGVFGEVTITATCPETGNTSTVTIFLAEGLIRELFHNIDDITWNITSSQALQGASSIWSYEKLDVSTYGSSKQRADFSKQDSYVWLHAGNYPIVAIKMNDVLDYDDVTGRNINVDSNTDDGSYKGSLGGGNNKWLMRYKCDDGSYVFIYDLTQQSFSTGGLLPTDASVKFKTFQWKYADMVVTPIQQLTYSVYWVQTFKTLTDIKSHLTSEGITWVEE
ncbi:Ig-like domain-containing protein [Saccharicrinis fermentans]|uniref:Ig-like domain n=1 Tax=Saccharicrinis fermentans DSM 9555 = JCM 21142 TaxID=869213 RepID=W7YC94_9BACT|nr:Ig-like domain-containing protein [Saccharicrinis fermentans]GAF05073.1 Ig-like domain [Saccharicrinis fermentans DSM 9555 = JCM 21142]